MISNLSDPKLTYMYPTKQLIQFHKNQNHKLFRGFIEVCETMTRTDKQIQVAQDVIQSLVNYCVRQKKEGLDIAELNATIVTLELEKRMK